MAPTVMTRQATAADYEAALPLLERFFVEEEFRTPLSQVREELTELLHNPESAVFVAWLGAQAVGVATVTTSRGIEFGYCAELEDLYVLPEARKSGVGNALVQAVKSWCQVQGCSVVYVVVTPEGQAVHNLIGYYCARGFEESGRTILFNHFLKSDAD